MAEVCTGAAPRAMLFRVRDGEGAGRIAAGVPRLLENASSVAACGQDAAPPSIGAPAGGRRGARRLLGLAALLLPVLLALALGSGSGVVSGGGGVVVSGGGGGGDDGGGNGGGPGVEAAGAMQLVAISSDGSLRLSADGLTRLRSQPTGVCVLSVAGAAGEGKSTLANALVSSMAGNSHGAAPSSQGGRFAVGGGELAPHGDGAARGGVWMWAGPETDAEAAAAVDADAAPAAQGGCRSYVVLDSEGLGGLSAGWEAYDSASASEAGAHKMLSLLMLSSSRIALNARRQPSTELLEKLAAAAATAAAVRPLPPPPPPADPAAEANLLPAPAPECDAAQSTHCASAAGAAAARPAGPAMTMLLRDAHLELASNGAAISEAEALGLWIPQPLGAAFPSWGLLQLAPPSEDELELLEREAAGAPAGWAAAADSAFGRRLAAAAENLTAGLRPLRLPGRAADADGEALAAWMAHVVERLNTREALRHL